jgi:hypothetical protein
MEIDRDVLARAGLEIAQAAQKARDDMDTYVRATSGLSNAYGTDATGRQLKGKFAQYDEKIQAYVSEFATELAGTSVGRSAPGRPGVADLLEEMALNTSVADVATEAAAWAALPDLPSIPKKGL